MMSSEYNCLSTSESVPFNFSSFWVLLSSWFVDKWQIPCLQENCHNFVRVLILHDDKVFTCGTNAFNPNCTWRDVSISYMWNRSRLLSFAIIYCNNPTGKCHRLITGLGGGRIYDDLLMLLGFFEPRVCLELRFDLIRLSKVFVTLESNRRLWPITKCCGTPQNQRNYCHLSKLRCRHKSAILEDQAKSVLQPQVCFITSERFSRSCMCRNFWQIKAVDWGIVKYSTEGTVFESLWICIMYAGALSIARTLKNLLSLLYKTSIVISFHLLVGTSVFHWNHLCA